MVFGTAIDDTGKFLPRGGGRRPNRESFQINNRVTTIEKMDVCFMLPIAAVNALISTLLETKSLYQSIVFYSYYHRRPILPPQIGVSAC